MKARREDCVPMLSITLTSWTTGRFSPVQLLTRDVSKEILKLSPIGPPRALAALQVN
jgi:hypothetical protein